MIAPVSTLQHRPYRPNFSCLQGVETAVRATLRLHPKAVIGANFATERVYREANILSDPTMINGAEPILDHNPVQFPARFPAILV